MIARPPRPSTWVLLLLALQVCALAVAVWDAQRAHPARQRSALEGARITRWLGLTDPALFTEAHYTRHPSLHAADAALQDHPLAQDHFPSGSLRVAPPPVPSWRDAAAPAATGGQP
ncbi:MAG: hypothetical protein Q4G70_15955 [Pseudomonadota bacterium]|nr:hypothetical protein [Pseudomonadota bacterium]